MDINLECLSAHFAKLYWQKNEQKELIWPDFCICSGYFLSKILGISDLVGFTDLIG